VFFILFVLGIIFTIKDFSWLIIILSVISLTVFIWLVVLHKTQNQKHTFVRNLIAINQNEHKAMDYDFSAFNNGEQFIHRDHAYAYDLDLFGEGSLFQFLNRTFSRVGRVLLAHKLLNPIQVKGSIENIQHAVQEMAERIDWRQNFQAIGQIIQISDDDNQKIDHWIKEPAYFIHKWFFKIVVTALPLITVTALVFLIMGRLHYSIFTLLALIQLFFASLMMRRTNKEQRLITEEIDILKNYQQLIRILENTTFKGKWLKKLQQQLYVNDNVKASKVLMKLTRIIDAFDTRLNLIVGLFLNATLMWDLLSLMRLEYWKERYGESIKNWIQVIAEADALCSMANYSYNHPLFIYPEITTDKILEAQELGHPLIRPERRVNNDFFMPRHGQINIITGANMAGKSTFLRTIGVNMILALNGMPVCAKQFKCKTLQLYSGMRSSDSLKENESYFYAELKRLKLMIEKLKSGEQLFILLDEILKGTNSVDKAEGSWKFVEHLIQLKATGIIATHDLTLCDLEVEYPDSIKNQCFEVEISGQKIFFDYILRKGVTKNMNASVLMKQMGIFPGV
jgi:DNA mismatch repair ATPase MutS